jgi:hypothetical protein
MHLRVVRQILRVLFFPAETVARKILGKANTTVELTVSRKASDVPIDSAESEPPNRYIYATLVRSADPKPTQCSWPQKRYKNFAKPWNGAISARGTRKENLEYLRTNPPALLPVRLPLQHSVQEQENGGKKEGTAAEQRVEEDQASCPCVPPSELHPVQEQAGQKAIENAEVIANDRISWPERVKVTETAVTEKMARVEDLFGDLVACALKCRALGDVKQDGGEQDSTIETERTDTEVAETERTEAKMEEELVTISPKMEEELEMEENLKMEEELVTISPVDKQNISPRPCSKAEPNARHKTLSTSLSRARTRMLMLASVAGAVALVLVSLSLARVPPYPKNLEIPNPLNLQVWLEWGARLGPLGKGLRASCSVASQDRPVKASLKSPAQAKYTSARVLHQEALPADSFRQRSTRPNPPLAHHDQEEAAGSEAGSGSDSGGLGGVGGALMETFEFVGMLAGSSLAAGIGCLGYWLVTQGD